MAGVTEIKLIQVQFGLSFLCDWKSLAVALDENPVPALNKNGRQKDNAHEIMILITYLPLLPTLRLVQNHIMGFILLCTVQEI